MAESSTQSHKLEEDDQPNENCGIVAIYAPELNLAHLLSLALVTNSKSSFHFCFKLTINWIFQVALQHRGQESCGIVTFSEKEVHEEKGLGLVSQVFGKENGRSLDGLKGHLGVAHVRYSTAGKIYISNISLEILKFER